MSHNFKVGDKVKVKPYSEFDFNDELYDMTDGDVFNIAGSVFTVIKINSDGDLYLDTWDKIEYSFVIHPQDVIQTSVKNPRPHAELIKQWADDDSLEIEFSIDGGQSWRLTTEPCWNGQYLYRMKPKTVTKWKWAYKHKRGGEDITRGHCSEEDLAEEYPLGSEYVKLEWTAKEFQVV